MKKNAKIASSSEEKSILSDAVNSSENEQLDLYKAIFGGVSSGCSVVAVGNLRSKVSAYDKHETFLQAIS
ncbi:MULTISPECIES: hypothetical protein [Pedobacter]|jgi:hypothetical protein|uniref:Uncharacterized protein n=1 Tax=Pedobacter cryoconitis TaxID=188932 RepID=A0A127V9I5_9SPHI|nr:hypothetical protein [Pedobacter cryoconitis]AMP98013.1 hypothetical protein AY601_1085 [Pedobacter cryoconitis]